MKLEQQHLILSSCLLMLLRIDAEDIIKLEEIVLVELIVQIWWRILLCF